MEGSHAVGNSGVDEGVLRNGIALDSKREGAQATANDKRHHDNRKHRKDAVGGPADPALTAATEKHGARKGQSRETRQTKQVGEHGPVLHDRDDDRLRVVLKEAEDDRADGRCVEAVKAEVDDRQKRRHKHAHEGKNARQLPEEGLPVGKENADPGGQ